MFAYELMTDLGQVVTRNLIGFAESAELRQAVLKPIRVASQARNSLRPLSEVSVLGLVRVTLMVSVRHVAVCDPTMQQLSGCVESP